MLTTVQQSPSPSPSLSPTCRDSGAASGAAGFSLLLKFHQSSVPVGLGALREKHPLDDAGLGCTDGVLSKREREREMTMPHLTELNTDFNKLRAQAC